ncbi:SAG family member [Eimeria brunetti]|uniref:SAG family member n=1 Tax=Eimeria brunetti TaxID=51314 RepID=U6L8T6_9EIME|nr:SAG family member [Eimeria brunetti]
MVLYKTAAAVCLVALYGLHSEAGTVTTTYKFKAVNVEDDAYFAAKLVRNGKLAVHISEVSKDEDLISELQEKVAPSADLEQQTGTSEVSCNKLMEDSGLKSIFHHAFSNVGSYNYHELFQAALDAGITVFKDKGYQNKWNEIWGDADGANLAYLLGANSTKIGCVIGECIKVQTQEDDEPPTTENPTGDAFLFCQLSPAADKNKAPFDEDYFNALTARTAKLAAMTEEDLKAPSNGASATAAIPTILVASLVAMLTAVPA